MTKILSLLFIFFFTTLSFAQANDKVYPENSSEVTVMGEGILKRNTVITYMQMKNKDITAPLALYIFKLYEKEGKVENVNIDIALAQMMIETNFLRYNGDVRPNQFNFAGIGAVGGGAKGAIFPNMQIGIRAQIQHLQAYGSTAALKQDLVDPRYKYVRRGIAPRLKDLTGKWATDPNYDTSIFRIINEMCELQKQL